MRTDQHALTSKARWKAITSPRWDDLTGTVALIDRTARPTDGVLDDGSDRFDELTEAIVDPKSISQRDIEHRQARRHKGHEEVAAELDPHVGRGGTKCSRVCHPSADFAANPHLAAAMTEIDHRPRRCVNTPGPGLNPYWRFRHD